MARGEGSGVGHPAPEDMWLIRPGTGKTPTVAFEVSGHEERAGGCACFMTFGQTVGGFRGVASVKSSPRAIVKTAELTKFGRDLEQGSICFSGADSITL